MTPHASTARTARTAWVVCLVMATLAWASPASARTVDVDVLRSRLETVAGGGEAQLSGIDAVRFDDGRVAEWDGVPLTGGRDTRVARARQLLATLDDLEASARPVSPERARRVARDVLGKEKEKPPGRRRMPEAPDLGFLGPVAEVLLWAVVIVLLAGLVFAIVSIVRNRRASPDDEEDDDTSVHVTTSVTGAAPKKPLAPDEWERRAREAAAEGRYADALRFLHHAGILRLDAAGHLRFQKGRTNGEYATLLASRDNDAATELRALSRSAEDAVFGDWSPPPNAVPEAESAWAGLRSRLASAGTGSREGTE